MKNKILLVGLILSVMLVFPVSVHAASWDISFAIYDYVNISVPDSVITDLFFHPDGVYLYEMGRTGNTIYQYSCSGGGWNLVGCIYNVKTISAQDGLSSDIFFKPDGTKLYEMGDSLNLIYQYSCSSAWDLSTCTYDNVNISTQDEYAFGLFFKPDGTKLYESGSYNNLIYQYSCSSAWDLSTCTYDNVNISTQDGSPDDIFFKPDGTKLYESGSANNQIFQYSCSSAWNLSTCTYDSITIETQGSDPTGLFFKPDGIKLYSADASSNKIFQYSLNTVPSTTTPTITPSTAYTTNNLECNATLTDAEDTTLNAYWFWYKNDALYLQGLTSSISNNTNTLITTLNSGNTSKTEEWICKVIPNDEIVNGTGENSSAKTISNSLPTEPTDLTNLGTHLTDHTPTVTWTKGTDADGDTVTTYVYVDEGTCAAVDPTTEEDSTASETMNLGSTVTLTNGVTYCWRARSHDGTSFSTSYSSEDEFRMNTEPTITTVTITPSTAYTANDLTCTVYGYDDAESDTAKFYFKWYKDNALQQTYYVTSGTTHVLLSGNTTRDETWKCQVIPYDGYENGTDINQTKTISNSVPTTPTTLTPTTGTYGGNDNTISIVCSGSTDADGGDSITYNIRGYYDSAWHDLELNGDGSYSWDISGLTTQTGVDLRCNATDGTDSSSYYNPAGTITVDNSAPGVSNQALNVSSVNGSLEQVNFSFTTSDAYAGMDDCWAELTLEDNSKSNITGTLVSQTCSILSAISQAGDFSFKPFANDTLGNINTTESVVSGVRVDISVGSSVQIYSPNLTDSGSYHVSFSKLIQLDNSLGSSSWGKIVTETLPSGVDVWWVYEGNACWSGSLIDTGAGNTVSWGADSPSGSDSYEIICYNYTNSVTVGTVNWVQNNTATSNLSTQYLRTNFNITEDVGESFNLTWDLAGTINGETDCYLNCTGNSNDASGGWHSYALSYGDWIVSETEGTQSLFQNMSRSSTSSTQWIINQTDLAVTNGQGFTFNSVNISEYCENDVSVNIVTGTSEITTNCSYEELSSDWITESNTGWRQDDAISNLSLQFINNTVTLDNIGSVGFTSIGYTPLGCPTGFSCDTVISWTVPVSDNTTTLNGNGDVMTDTLGGWRQNSELESIAGYFTHVTRNITVENNGTINFSSIELNLVDRAGWSCLNNISIVNVNASDWYNDTHVINCSYNIIPIIKGQDWRQDTIYDTEAGDLAEIEGNINYTNNDTLNYTNILYNNNSHNSSAYRINWTCVWNNSRNSTFNITSGANNVTSSYPLQCYQNNTINKTQSDYVIEDVHIIVDVNVSSYYNISGTNNDAELEFNDTFVRTIIPINTTYYNVSPYLFRENLTAGESYFNRINITGKPVVEASYATLSNIVGNYTHRYYTAELSVYDSKVSSKKIVYRIPLSRLSVWGNRSTELDSYSVDDQTSGLEVGNDSDYLYINITTAFGSSSLEEGAHTIVFNYYVLLTGEEIPIGGGGGAAATTVYKLESSPGQILAKIFEPEECTTFVVNLTWNGPKSNARVHISEDISDYVVSPKEGDVIQVESDKVVQLPIRFCVPEGNNETLQQVIERIEVLEKTWAGFIELRIDTTGGMVVTKINTLLQKGTYEELIKPEIVGPPEILVFRVKAGSVLGLFGMAVLSLGLGIRPSKKKE